MDKVASQFIQQALKVSHSVHSATSNKSLFHLYLSLFEEGALNSARFVQQDQTSSKKDELASLLIESNYYRKPALVFTNEDFVTQQHYSKVLSSSDSASLHLLKAMHPQGLAQKNNAFAIDSDTLANSSYHTQKKLAFEPEEIEDTELPIDPTLLNDLIPASHTFSNKL